MTQGTGILTIADVRVEQSIHVHRQMVILSSVFPHGQVAEDVYSWNFL